MIKIANINANDERDGDNIIIGCEPYTTADYGTGYKVVADNGADIGYYKPQSLKKCIADIYAMYAAWDTFDDTYKAASALGRKGGASKSVAKVRAARDNGKKGGRPKTARKG